MFSTHTESKANLIWLEMAESLIIGMDLLSMNMAPQPEDHKIFSSSKDGMR
jgi:hypothetical protein